jgi:HK97 family phage major capsid protein
MLEYARLDATVLQVKRASPDGRTFTGVATTPRLDRQGHSVDPAGVTFLNPLPLLFQHDQDVPIGSVIFGPATAAGIPFEATFATVDEPGALRDRVELARQLVASRLIKSVSIGFRILDGAVAAIKGGFRLLRTEVVELSLVTIPSNPDAAILLVKSLAAPGPTPPPRPAPAPARAIMTIPEQIRSYETTRNAAAADMVAMMAAAAERGETLDATEQERFDGLDLRVKSFDDQMTRLRRIETLNLQQLAPVPTTPSPRSPVVSVKSNLEPGILYTRAIMALVRSNFNRHEAAELATKQWSDTPEVALFIKAAVAPGTTTDPAWAAPLVRPDAVSSEFIDLLRPATALGKINFMRVPFGVAVPILTNGGIYGWTGEGAPKHVTKLGFATDKLPLTKATGIIVLTDELVRTSNPDAEVICRNAMIKGIAAFLDSQLLDPAVAPVANVSPGSITNGTTAIPTTGSALADIHAIVSALSAANVPLGGLTLIMSETNALTLGMVRDPQGNHAFGGLTSSGGTVDGIKVVTSNAAGTNVIGVQPELVIYSDFGGVAIDMSRDATLQMSDAPMHPTDATAVWTNLFQNNLVALRAEQYVGWKRIVLAAVKYVSGATYAPTYGAPQGLGGAGVQKAPNGKQA